MKKRNRTKPEKVLELPWIDYHVAHSSPGRLRFKIPRLKEYILYCSNLEKLISCNSSIVDYRLNLAASSLVISYNSEDQAKQAFLVYLDGIIRKAALSDLDGNNQTHIIAREEKNLGLPMFALATSLVAIPLELPFFVVGALIVAASGTLWQRVNSNKETPINFDSLDALWLGSQLFSGNLVAGALALNLSQVGENLRQTNIKTIENQLYRSLEANVNSPQDQKWSDSVEDTELLRQIKPLAQQSIVPILVLTGVTTLLTNDLGRAAAWLPLNLGLSLRGITPLAIVSSLDKAAQFGVHIPDGKTLEKLAKVDYLLTSTDAPKERAENVAWLEDSYLVLGQDGSKIVLDSQNDLSRVEQSIDLAQETISTIYQSIGLVTSLNMSAVFLGVFLGVDPVITVLINAGAAIAGELNSLKLHQRIRTN